jgi:hypothetical protein
MPSVSSRTSWQCARPGWQPRRTSRRRLAQDIARSIQQARQHGDLRPIGLYTHDPDLAAMVQVLLDAASAQQSEAWPIPADPECL